MATGPMNPSDLPPHLIAQDWKAGQEYATALKDLGMKPQAVCWIHSWLDESTTEKRLAVVTSMVDRVPPKEVYDLLFRAYDLAATPREIDPFIVELFSPESWWGFYIQRTVGMEIDRPRINTLSLQQKIPGFEHSLLVATTGIYVSDPLKHSALNDLRAFERFKQKVTNLEKTKGSEQLKGLTYRL